MSGADYTRQGAVAVIRLDNPPVNALAYAVRAGILAELDKANADPAVSAVVLAGAGRSFSAGADINELGTPKSVLEPNLLTVIREVERSGKPVVAAIHGVASGGGLDPQVHKGSGYLLRPEWTIDDQPFATVEVPTPGWWLVSREPVAATLNRAYHAQEEILASLGGGVERPRRRSAVEIAFDTLCWHRAHGERLLARHWDWSRSVTTDQGYAALGEFGEQGLRVIAYSRAVRFGTLGACLQR